MYYYKDRRIIENLRCVVASCYMQVWTLRGAADLGLQVLEPLDLGVQGARAPDGVLEAARLEEGHVQRRGARDGEVGAAVECRVLRLGRRQQRQTQLLRCSSRRQGQ
jgi:hypothetical protein